MNDLFSSNPETINKTAYVNWRTKLDEGPHNLIILGDSFFDSALILIDFALKNNERKIADSIIFSILHNVNHAIELHLKALEYSLNIELGNGVLFSGGHDVLQLLQTVLARIQELEGQKKRNEFRGVFKYLSKYIDEIYAKVDIVSNNQKLEFSRYPMKTDKRNAHFYVKAMENVEIDLENYKKIIVEIRKSLEQALDYFYHANE